MFFISPFIAMFALLNDARAVDCNAVGWAMADSLCDDASPGSCAATCDSLGDSIDYTCNSHPQVWDPDGDEAIEYERAVEGKTEIEPGDADVRPDPRAPVKK